MPAPVRLLIGDDPSALAAAALTDCVAALQQAQRDRQAGVVLWIAPARRAQRDVSRRLAAACGPVCLGAQVVTFDGFAEWVLQRAGRPATALSPVVRRLLLRRLTRELAERGELSHFQPVAQTAGLLDVVESFIAELKQDEIWPADFLAACRDNAATAARDRELGRIYQRYQDVLHAQNSYDNEGRFWQAWRLIADGVCPLPQWLSIFVVGFADFTTTQYEILERLAARTQRLTITLPGEETAARGDLFAKAHAAQQRLRQGRPDLQVVPIGGGGRTERPARAAVRAGLFRNPRDWSAVSDAAGLEVVAATGPVSERGAVIGRIKELLRSGVRPRDIVVGLRSLDVDGLAWRDAMAASGLPAWCEIGPPLKQTGLMKFLTALLQCELEDWPFARLTGVLGSSYFQPSRRAAAGVPDLRCVASALRRLQLPQDRAVILRVLERTASRATDADATQRNEPPLSVLAAAALGWLRWYTELTAPLRRTHALADWIDVLAELVHQLRCVAPGEAGGDVGEDARVWDRMQRTLRDAAVAEADWEGLTRRLTLAEFCDEFRDLLARERLDPPPEHPGFIRILSLEELRQVDVPHLFLAALSEESFPRRRGDDCLFSDAEREQLAARGLPLRRQALHQQDELFLYYSLLLRATRHLTLSYADVDGRGQPAFPSPYLSATRMLFAADAWPLQREGQLDPLPLLERVLTPADFRLVAVDAARSGRLGWLRRLCDEPATRPLAANLLAACAMAVARFHTRGFTPYEGRLAQPENLATLRQRFGAQRQFSATELEHFAACPFRFWLETVLAVGPQETPDGGADHLRRGTVVHEVLAQLLREGVDHRAAQELTERFRQLTAEQLGRHVGETELQQALTRIERRLLDEWATAYAEQAGRYADLLSEAWDGASSSAPPEIPFGDVPEPKAADEAPAPPLLLGRGDEVVAVRGRIDRIDYGTVEGRRVYMVIDYKTGKRPPFSLKAVQSGHALQLALYALAVQRLGLGPGDAEPFQLGYWALKETGFRAGAGSRGERLSPLDEAAWRALEQTLEETVPRLAARIRGGEFVVENADLNCTGLCSFKTVCRVNQVRPLAEQLDKRTALPVSTEEEEPS